MISLAAGSKISVSEACKYLSEVGLCAKEYISRDFDKFYIKFLDSCLKSSYYEYKKSIHWTLFKDFAYRWNIVNINGTELKDGISAATEEGKEDEIKYFFSEKNDVEIPEGVLPGGDIPEGELPEVETPADGE